MSHTIYQATISTIGQFATDVLADGMLIIFKNGAPDALADYCFCHTHSELKQDLIIGQILILGSQKYPITAVGEVATQNLRELGHITIRFDSNPSAELPGTIHVAGITPHKLTIGDEIRFLII